MAWFYLNNSYRYSLEIYILVLILTTISFWRSKALHFAHVGVTFDSNYGSSDSKLGSIEHVTGLSIQSWNDSEPGT